MGQQTLDRPTADAGEHKYKPISPDKAMDCTDSYCKPITMDQLEKELGPEQFKKFQEHAAAEATKNEYFHPDSAAGKMMNGFSIKDGKKAASQENNLFGDERNEIPGGKKQDAGSDKTKEDGKVDDKPKSEWDKKIEASGAFTVGQAKDAYNAAAAEKDGIAIIIGSKSTPGSQELLDKLPELQKENPNLKFMFVDKDAVAQKLAENPNDKSMQNWDKWIKDSQKDCSGQPIDLAFTSVQSLKADENGKVGPDKVTSTHWTADINAGLQDQGRYAANATARNLANANSKLDFTPPTEVKPPNKEETPFLKEDTEQVDNKAKEDQEKEAQAAKESEATKDKQKEETSEQQEAAKKLEQEQQLERQKRIKEATNHKYSGNDIEEVKRLSRELGLPIVMEIGYEGTDRNNPCPPCRALNGAMERGLADEFKGRALVVKSGLGELNGRIGQQIPGFNDSTSRPGEGGSVPYSTAGYVGTDGKIHTLGSGVRGFSGAESWKASMNREINNVNKHFEKYRKNK